MYHYCSYQRYDEGILYISDVQYHYIYRGIEHIITSIQRSHHHLHLETIRRLRCSSA